MYRHPHAQHRTRWAIGLLAVLLAGAVQAQDTPSVQSVEHVALGTNAVRITVNLDGPAPEPRSFFVEQPARLSIDLPQTGIAPETKRVHPINIGATRSLALAEAQGRTRAVVELTEALPYRLQRDGNALVILINAEGAGDAPVASAARPDASAPAATQPARIRAVDFRRSEDGGGRVIVDLNRADTRISTRESGGRVVALFRDAGAKESLYQRLDVLDFATPVKFIDLRPKGDDSELVVIPVDDARFEQVAYQAGTQYTIELKPLSMQAEAERDATEPSFDGERVSLSFQDVEVRALLQIIADVAEVNLVVSDTVDGSMTLRLDNVPWDQALDIVLRQQGLGMEQQGNVMLVAPNEEISDRAEEAREARQARAELAPLRTEVIQVNYSRATELAAIIREASQQTGGGTASGGNVGTESELLSRRGKITVDERTNTLIVQEARSNLDAIRRLVSRLDVPVRQVLIESRIAIVNDDFQKELGVQAGFTSIGTSGDVTIGASGSAAGADAVINGGIPTLSDRLGVRLPVPDPTGRFGLAVLGSDFLVDLELSAMQSEGRGELVSTPRVVTADRSEATIKQGLQVPITTRSQQDANSTTTEFVDALLELRVTPEITPDDGVFLNLFVTRNEPDFTQVNADGNPAIATREVSTRVLVRTGETLVLGGAYQSEKTENVFKVPLLGDIPIIGRLFRREANMRSQRELLVFVTPKILAEGLSIGDTND
ncbi:type IV pilus secretin PilQ [Algiphilus sp.]|uniref:type IV pilus secretin PilQ n=1 Tax=Algiphilus sp. TaxID=1872431 RepID=UPI0032EB97B5